MDIDFLTPEIRQELKELPVNELQKILFLENHPAYPTYYLVEALDPMYVHYLKDIIGEYKSIFMFDVDKLRDKAQEFGYDRVVYMNDPTEVIDRYDHLNDPYPFQLNVDLKPFQLQGFNYCKDLKSDIINWSTGVGKSVYAVAKAKYLLESNLVDKIVIVSKGHNKINWQTQLMAIGELKSEVAEAVGNNALLRRERRTEIYKNNNIFVINYEKLRFRPKSKGEYSARTQTGDGAELLEVLKGQRVYFVWDEMPMKLKNKSTVAWKGANKILKGVGLAYQSLLSATPLENSPEDVYSCVKLLDPTIFGSLQDFRNQYAKSFNPFMKWMVSSWDTNKMQEMGMRLSHMTHVANKYRDPEIRAQFPEEHWEDIIIDMSPEDRKLYTQVEKKLAEEFDLDPTENILPKLQVLQTICNNPLWLKLGNSDIAKKILEKRVVTDHFCSKLETLHDMLDQIEGKVVLFSMYNELGSQPLSHYLKTWGFSFVLYHGTEKELQKAQDSFTSDPNIKIFVSSDMGSDSINLHQATTVINYDLPWKYSTLLQRVNRINRITSEADHVWYFNLITAGTMEQRKQTILLKKKDLHDALGEPGSHHAEAIATLTMSDYKWILTGHE